MRAHLGETYDAMQEEARARNAHTLKPDSLTCRTENILHPARAYVHNIFTGQNVCHSVFW